MELIIDERQQRLEALHSIMGSAGIKLFVEEMNNLKLGMDSQLESYMHEPVDQNKLAKLNFQLGKKKAYEIVFEVLDSFREELEDRENSPSKA